MSATPPLHDGRVWWSPGEAWRWRHAAVDPGGRPGGDATPGERAHRAPLPAPPATVGGGASSIGEGRIAPGRRVSSPSRVRLAPEARVVGAGGRWGDPSLLAPALPPHILLRTHSMSSSAGSNTGHLPALNFGLSAVCAPAMVPRHGSRRASSANGPSPPPQNLSRTHCMSASEGSNTGHLHAPSLGLFSPAAGCAPATAPNAGPGLQWAPPSGDPPPPARAPRPRTCSRSPAMSGSSPRYTPCMRHAEATTPKGTLGSRGGARSRRLPVGSARTEYPSFFTGCARYLAHP